MVTARMSKDLACDCAAPTIHTQKVMSSDVFVGLVRSVSESANVRRGRVFIERSWKGTQAGKTVVLATPSMGPACGVEFKTGDRVIVFANPGRSEELSGTLWTDVCDRSSAYPTLVAALSESLGTPVSTAKLSPSWRWW